MFVKASEPPLELANYEGVLVPGSEAEPKLSEQEIALVVQRYLEEHGHKTYPEVELTGVRGRADLIAARRGVVTVLECKVSMTLGLLEQATRWHERMMHVQEGYAQQRGGMPHLIYVVVGRTLIQHSALGHANRLLQEIIERYRLGVMSVCKHPQTVWNPGTEDEMTNPVRYRLQLERSAEVQPGSRQTGKALTSLLNPDTRCAIPGSRGGKTVFMTDFKRTAIKMATFMLDGKPRSIKEIVQELNRRGGHHYANDASAIGSLAGMMPKIGYQAVGTERGVAQQFKANIDYLRCYLQSHGVSAPIAQ
jgi:hypothetical protein